MAIITITVRPEKLAELRDRFPDDIATAKVNIARRMETQGRAKVASMLGRWQTGALAQSLTAEATARGIMIEIGQAIDYADWVFFGADPHIITPKNAKALHWARFGTDFFFGKVQHPGQKARTDIFNALEELLIKIVQEEVIAIIRAREIAAR